MRASLTSTGTSHCDTDLLSLRLAVLKLSFLTALYVLSYFLNHNLLSVECAQLNQEKEEVEQKKNEFSLKMRQLEHVMGSATEYPQVLSQKLHFRIINFTNEEKIVNNGGFCLFCCCILLF
jgi:hypothetical protein